ncbi:hypothetical protein HMPREF1624_05689 [Sporothrix schenckii ATCC 58251]|uniref:Uncharacterized protein n=1 Tax=Sporothrix schenckii (strain ATCC 58251 / de Perez 2211183) TaxID=1391915 RepID=U7PST6_SPOS1|nr:hypothetical protein HMPREF1624_05689 [Sporothrix schenckii ATCC 58251]
MLTTSASTLAPRVRLAQSRILGSRTLAAAGTVAVLTRHRQLQQQTRGFGFGWWADHVDHEQRREMRRRYKALHHRYSDAVNRKMLWEQQHANNADAPAYRRCTQHYWQPKRYFAFSRYRSNKDNFFKSSETSSSNRTSKSNATGAEPTIEDVERNAWGHFLFRDGERTHPSWSSSFDDIRSYIARRQEDLLNETPFGTPTANATKTTSSASSSASGVSASTSSSSGTLHPDADYVIDPITNRKVSKSSAKSTPDEVVYDMDLPPTQAEMRAYKNVSVDDSAFHNPTIGAAVADSISFKSLGDEEAPKYDDLDKYKPIKHNEPDGKPTDAPVEIGHEGYDEAEVQQYKPFKWNEPDGKPVDKTVELGHEGYDPEELAKYKPFLWNEPDGQPNTEPAELGHAGYDPAEVQQYQAFRWNEPHGQPKDRPVELGHTGYDQAEVQQYQPFGYHEPHGRPPVANEEKGHHGYDAAEVQSYKAFRYNDPDGKPPITTGELGREGYDPVEVQTYQAVRYNEPDGKASETAEDVTDSSELSSYGAVRYQEPDGKPSVSADSTADSLKEYDTTSANTEPYDEAYSTVLRELRALSPHDGDAAAPSNGSYGSESESGGAGTASASGKQAKNDGARPSRSALESSMDRISAEHDAIDTLASVSIKSHKSRARKQMTDAERKQAQLDPYCTKPQGLETAYAEECGGEGTVPIFVKTHKRVDRDAPSLPVAATSTPTEPFVFKILAYNPGMNTIDTAETSSTVPDASSPMPAADVLLRLSNPAKFFPHFEPLRAQGFEIVSGSGDVLIFRKVREPSDGEGSAPSKTPTPQIAQKTTRRAMPATTVNPIDMTGKHGYVPPSTANFVSPTGYVNLDLPHLHEGSAASSADLPSPPPASAKASSTSFQSGIGVRREEPVFSGPKDSSSKAGTTAGPGVAKRMVVGATWVAGVSYVIGVASEYVKGR